MISRSLYAIEIAFSYVKQHPQIWFAFLLLFLIPLLFLYTGAHFLSISRDNQETILKQRVGLMQDVFVALLESTDFNSQTAQHHIESIAATNPDITGFRVVKQQGDDFIAIAALRSDVIGQAEPSSDFYRISLGSADESIIFPFSDNSGRLWQAYRSILTEDREVYFIFTQFSLASVDGVLKSREETLWWYLALVYIVFLGLTYWLIRQTDFRHMYLEVKKANETKDLFTNMIAHELRAPLTAIRGYASLVEEGTDAASAKTHVAHIRESSERLLTLVNDLLDVARIQSGKLSVKKDSIDISPVIQKVVDEIGVSAQEKSVTISATGIATPHIVIGDALRLQQALTNLVSNAIKYTKEGSIELAVTDIRDQVEIRVKDTGMGISAEDQKKLFAPFFRVSSESVSAITGTGLGMWITKQLIELMGAWIGVESIKGIGTHIVVRLPKTAAKH